jgi:hypothetical protein
VIEVRPNRYFVGLWHLRGIASDFLAVLYKDVGQPYVIHYTVSNPTESRGFFIPDIPNRQQGIQIMGAITNGLQKRGDFGKTITKVAINSGKPQQVCRTIRRAAETGKIHNVQMREER